MLVVGLTGGIGSGKSIICQQFKSLGIDVIDTDIIARELVVVGSSCFTKIVNHFGDKILTNNKNINRSKLREIIFSDITQKVWLENLLHPKIYQEVLTKVKESKSPYCVISIPLLIEKIDQYQNLVNKILVIDAPETTQIMRTIKRDNTDEESVKEIINQQASRKTRISMADDIIDNTKDLAYLNKTVYELHKKYQNLKT